VLISLARRAEGRPSPGTVASAGRRAAGRKFRAHSPERARRHPTTGVAVRTATVDSPVTAGL